MKAFLFRLGLCLLLDVGCIQAAVTTENQSQVASPDKKLIVNLSLTTNGTPVYSMTYLGRPLLTESRLGLALENAVGFQDGLHISQSATTTQNKKWIPIAGERSEITDHYNQLVVDFQNHAIPPQKMQVTFRAYDEGVAFSYTIPKQDNLKDFTISREATEFRLPTDAPCWTAYTAQGIYTNKLASQIGANCERPLVIEFTNGPVVAIGEARLVDYARMRLKNFGDGSPTLVPDLGSMVKAAPPFTTPWRFILIGNSPGQLIEHNYLVQNLNDPCALADTSWIKPGKVIREGTLSTTGCVACVDFAVKMNLQYIELDAGWYGPENSINSDATKVNVTSKNPDHAPLDLPAVLSYAKAHGIGVILYVNHIALERQLEAILPLYEKWGVSGIKFGFVNVGSQKWTSWLHEAVRKCAQHHLLVDIHDEYRPTGYSRTYPNLLTQEGVRGNETMPPAWHNAVLPFTRYLCGPADYTVCWYDKRIKTTHAHQLAASTVYFSPWQFLFWYDRPAQCQWEPELDFFKQLPTVWDETRVVNGEIGKHITTARRKGDAWFVGTLNSGERRLLDISLNFLKPAQKYTAWIYSDAHPEGGAPTQVTIRQTAVDAKTILRADMADNGGQAIRIAPVE